TERTYHYVLENDIERSHTDFQATVLDPEIKTRLLQAILTEERDSQAIQDCPGFAITFDTVSETGDRVGMSLKALFVPERLIAAQHLPGELPIPIAAEVAVNEDLIQGFYLRDEGYYEAGAIAGRFTYHAIRQTLEMTTFYRRSVAVDQMRFISPDLRLRTIVTYQRPDGVESPSVISLVGFGMEQRVG
ncbi:MAG: phycobiliprotein lyase, partial [Synechococcales bacterium]|nr:phycobiliprotein lyase [Synechococcales bacterium]